jgi:hypothetical protein
MPPDRGPARVRTGDLRPAETARYQLRYKPIECSAGRGVAPATGIAMVTPGSYGGWLCFAAVPEPGD